MAKEDPTYYIKKALKSRENALLFGDYDDSLDQACIDFLEGRGYIVSKPQEVKYKNVKSGRDLIELFYNGLIRAKGVSLNRIYRNELRRDQATAKKFIESRKSAMGCSEAAAIKDCVSVIETVLNYYEDFGFKHEPSFSIFGQDKLGWVTEKALYIRAKKAKEKDEQIVEAYQDAIEREGNEKGEAESNLEELRALADKLERLNAN
jgi:hypothetical protein